MAMNRLLALIVIAGTVAAAAADTPIALLNSSFFGTAEDDDIKSACPGPGGTIYIAGNTGAAMDRLPAGVKPTRLGKDAAKPRCGHGFVAQLNAAGTEVLAYAEFPMGSVSLTTVRANDECVYVAGYATDMLEGLIKDVPGVIKGYPLRKDVKLVEDGNWMRAVGENPEKPDPIPESNHGQLGRYGAPFVVRFSTDLKTIEGGTYLEGWQQVWAKNRIVGGRPGPDWPEYYWTPTHVVLLDDGDVAVCHDGGYFRLLTEQDEAFVEKTVARLVAEKWVPGNRHEAKRAVKMSDEERRRYYRAKLRKIIGFYDVSDHLSRLTAGLDRRVYVKPIHTPATVQKVAARLKYGWPYPHFSNPRTHRMCRDDEGRLYLSGWSASFTSQEPWWAGYVWQVDPKDGAVIRKILERDPMSGKGNRMGGAVADRGVYAVAPGPDRLYYNSYSDGGWNACIHFSGSIMRWTPGDESETKGLTRTGPCCWVTDMQVLPGDRLLAVGRENNMTGWSKDAWQDGGYTSPECWLALYHDIGDSLRRSFFTPVRGVWPHELVRLSDTRYAMVGTSWATINLPVKKDGKIRAIREVNTGVAVTRNAMFDKHAGKNDGYFMIVECRNAKQMR